MSAVRTGAPLLLLDAPLRLPDSHPLFERVTGRGEELTRNGVSKSAHPQEAAVPNPEPSTGNAYRTTNPTKTRRRGP